MIYLNDDMVDDMSEQFTKLFVLFVLSTIMISYILPLNLKLISPETVYSVFSGSPTHPYLTETYQLNIQQIIKKYALFTYNDQLLLIYSYGANTSILFGNFSSTIGTPYGELLYYIFDDYLLIIEHGSDAIHIVLYNLSSPREVLDNIVDTYNLVAVRCSGVYYDNTTGHIHVYYTLLSLSANMYLQEIIIDPINAGIIVNTPIKINGYIYTGNIVYGIKTGVFPSTVLVDNNVTIEVVNKTINVQIDNAGKAVQGQPIIDPPIISLQNFYVIPYNNSNTLSLLIYDSSRRNFYTETFPLEYNGFSLAGVYPIGSYLSLIYSATDYSLLIKYYNVLENSTFDIHVESTDPLKTLFITDQDNDAYPEPITKNDEFYVLTYTSSNNSVIIYWDHLLKHIPSKYDTVLVNSTIYYMLAYVNETSFSSRIILLRYAENATVDYTPPMIYVSMPKNNSCVSAPVVVNASFIEDESDVYISYVSLFNQRSNLIYSSYTRGNRFIKQFNLDEGIYVLRIRSWNVYGYSSSTDVVFRVLDNHVEVVHPSNWSVVGASYDLVLLSDSAYSVEISINGTITINYTLTPGTNTIPINTTFLPDGLYCLKIRIIDLNYTLHLLLIKDSKPPSIIVNGLENNTVISGVKNVSFTVNDEHFENLTVTLDSKVIFETRSTGIHYILLNTLEYPNGEYYLLFKAVDKAYNTAIVTYKITINNTMQSPVITINPSPPNNSFVEGVVEFNIAGNSVFSISIIIDGEQYLSIPSINGTINTNVSIDTTKLVDGEHVIIINASCYYGENILYKYIWYVDNNSPKLYMRIPVIGVGGTWINNSVIPRFNPVKKDIIYVREYYGSYLIPLYINVSDAFLTNATLYINNSIARIIVDNNEKHGVFNESRGYLVKLILPREGYYILKLKGYDQAGHFSTYVIGFYLDLHPPIVNILSLINNTFMDTRNITFMFRVLDNISKRIFAGINVQKDKYTIPDLDDYFPITTIGFTAGTVINQSVKFGSDGVYYVSFIFIDEGMNYRIILFKLVIDTEPPAVNITSSTRNNYFTAMINITDKLSPIIYTEIYVNNTLVRNVSSTTNTSYIEIALDPGIYNITVISVDKAGNKAVITKVVEASTTYTSPSTTPATHQTPITNTSTETSPSSTGASNEGGSRQSYFYATLIAVVAIVFILILWYRRKAR